MRPLILVIAPLFDSRLNLNLIMSPESRLESSPSADGRSAPLVRIILLAVRPCQLEGMCAHCTNAYKRNAVSVSHARLMLFIKFIHHLPTRQTFCSFLRFASSLSSLVRDVAATSSPFLLVSPSAHRATCLSVCLRDH